MKIYLVGGAVRDKLLGLPVKERDYVVVGATVKDMLNLGYRQVGKEFPVFLHPKTSEEYALARKERKVNAGYKGFTFDTSPDVTLEADLLRRDLTINAMAESPEGEIIDPYHGRQDLEKKRLRHISDAFAEDPVRILRVGRFLARYAYLGFKVAPETIELMRQMVKLGEVDALVAERVWKELERALAEKNPEKFFEVLAACDALPILFPPLSLTSQGMEALKAATQLKAEPIIRFAVLLYDMQDAKKNMTDLCNRYRVPNAYRELALITSNYVKEALFAKTASAEALLRLLNALDIYRREERFNHFLVCCQAIALSEGLSFDRDWFLSLAKAAKAVNVQELIDEGLEGKMLADKIQEKRLENIQVYLISTR